MPWGNAMSLTTSALQIGSSALISYQQALQLAGNNIANAGNPHFTRQTALFDPRVTGNVGGLQIGTGVQISSIQRNISEALEARLRSAISDQSSAGARYTALARVETTLDGLGVTNLGTTLTDLFKSFSDLQNNPEDAAARGLVVQRGAAVSEAVKKQRLDLVNLREDLNTDVADFAKRADELAGQIADLNVQITSAQASGGDAAAGGLKDQRGNLLQQLSQIVDIATKEQTTGSINVYVGSEPLVQGGISRGLTTTQESAGNGLTNAVVRFKDNNSQAVIRGGQIAGAIDARDNAADVQLSRLNTLASAIIQEVNKRHASGQGLEGFTSLLGTYGVLDNNAALNSAAAGLDLKPQSGTFFIDAKDKSTGQSTRVQINIDLDGQNGNDTTLTSLAAQINAALPGKVTAVAQPDGRLNLTATSGLTFSFADDRSNVLAGLGLNTFFTGKDASDIDVNALISDTPSLLAAATQGTPGDGSNAGLLAKVADAVSSLLGGVSLTDFHQASVSRSAVDSNSAKNSADATDTIFGSIQAQHESISGVNLDEEAVKLVAFQRAYQGAAKYLTTIDAMLQTLLSLVK